MTLKIGYLIQDFAPEVGAGPARVFEMASRWQQSGAEVTVITGMPNRRLPGRPDGFVHPDYRRKLFVEEQRDGLRVLRSWVFASPRRGFGWTLANNVSFMASGFMNGVAKAGALDILIASGPPFFAQVAGEFIRRSRRIPLVIELRDLWPDYLVQMGVIRHRLARRALFGMEDFLLRNADHAVVVTESLRQRVALKGIPHERIDVVPNGVDLGYYARSAEPLPLAGLNIPRDQPVIGYIGTFGAGQGLRFVVEAAAILKERQVPGRFLLVGDGSERRMIEALIAKLGVADRVSLHPPLPKDQTRSFHNACDISVVPLAPIPIFQETVPSKLFEILACETPIVAALGGEGAHIVNESGGGLVVPPGEPVAMADAIQRLLATSVEERRRMGVQGREYVRQRFDRELLADRYLALLKRIAHARGVSRAFDPRATLAAPEA